MRFKDFFYVISVLKAKLVNWRILSSAALTIDIMLGPTFTTELCPFRVVILTLRTFHPPNHRSFFILLFCLIIPIQLINSAFKRSCHFER